MKSHSRIKSHDMSMRLAMALVISALIFSIPVLPVSAVGTIYGGNAIGVSINPFTVNTAISATGPLPTQGGELDANATSAQDKLVQGDVLLSVITGYNSTTESTTALAGITLLPGTQNNVTADFVKGNSQASCAGVSGASEVDNLKIGGQQINVSGLPNQIVYIPGVLTLVINEQINSTARSGNATSNSITVYALDLHLPTGEQVIVSSTNSTLVC